MGWSFNLACHQGYCCGIKSFNTIRPKYMTQTNA